jgi:response regulator RpfG family c-di-GMP phosphodiesterase
MLGRQSWGRIWNGTVIRTCPSNPKGLEEGNDKLLTLRDYFVILMLRPQTGDGRPIIIPLLSVIFSWDCCWLLKDNSSWPGAILRSIFFFNPHPALLPPRRGGTIYGRNFREPLYLYIVIKKDDDPANMKTSSLLNLLFEKKLRVISGGLGEDQKGGYCPLNLKSLIPGGRLTFPLFLKSVEVGSDKIKYLQCCEVDEIFSEEWIKGLHQIGVQRLYFLKNDFAKVIDYLNNYLTILESQGQRANNQKLRVLHEHLNLTIQQAFASKQFCSYIEPMVRVADRILEELGNNLITLKSLWELLILDYAHYNHAINVFFISLNFMCFLRKKRSEIRNMGMCALFKDVGMTKVPEEILLKPGKLLITDLSRIKKHPRESYNDLKKHIIIPPEALQLIIEHHENADGSGYPQQLKNVQQHPNTKIVRVVDAYAAMISHRPYRPPYNPSSAVKLLQEEVGPYGFLFDQEILVNFLKFLAIFNK